ncbi:MAG: Rnase Y domain-containing protein, partial [Oscillospiraceae bacterium]|nr:Rnase Y domain-containing protein [Oscillospiraceae bacterium]
MNFTPMTIITAIVSAVIVGVVCFFFGIMYRRKVAEARIGSAEDEARRIVNDAIKNAEQRRKEVVLEAKDEIFKMRNESEKELRERRSEASRQERRLSQKEESLEKKQEQFERESQSLQDRKKNLDDKLAEVEQLKKNQFEILERISGLSESQAKDMLLAQLDRELDHEKALRIKVYEQNLNDEAEVLAQNIVTMAIARTAADHSSEATVSVVSLPNDEMKGRIIGREGRNIRTIETVTGVDLIIDDTPEAIT